MAVEKMLAARSHPNSPPLPDKSRTGNRVPTTGPRDRRVEVRRAIYDVGGRQVLCGLDLDLHAGEIFGLLGPNGVGKSTLMRAIAGRLRLASGSIAIDGRMAGGALRGVVSYVPQEISIFPHLTVAENLRVFGRFSGVSGAKLGDQVDSVLMRAGLGERADQLCRTLSGGYQRRVNICASIVNEPTVLLLDEPTVGIDVDAREAIHGLLAGLRARDAALMIATHDLDQAHVLCDRVGLMRDGQIGLVGNPDVLVRDHFGSDMEVIVTLRAPLSDPGRAAITRMGFSATQSPTTWVTHAPAGRLEAGEIATRFERSGLPLKELRVRQPDLSSLFLAVLGRGVAQ